MVEQHNKRYDIILQQHCFHATRVKRLLKPLKPSENFFSVITIECFNIIFLPPSYNAYACNNGLTTIINQCLKTSAHNKRLLQTKICSLYYDLKLWEIC